MNTQTDMSATNGNTFGYAISPPATGEYNRYPGHPASTCLSVGYADVFARTETGKLVGSFNDVEAIYPTASVTKTP